MSMKTTVLLLVVVIGLGAIAWKAGVFSPQTDTTDDTETPRSTQSGAPLYEPAIEEVTAITIERAGRGSMAFEKRDDTWYITSPVQQKATSWQVDSLTRTITGLRVLESFAPGTDGIDLAAAGLDSPRMTITFTGDGKQRTIRVGKNVIASDMTYVQAGDDTNIRVVDKNLTEQIKSDIDEYRDKKLMDFDTAQATAVTFTTNDTTYQLVKSDGGWVIESPIRTPADGEKISTMLSDINNLRAQGFANADAADADMYGLDPAQVLITITCTETVEPEPDDTDTTDTQPAEPKAPETITTRHTLRVGSLATVGDKVGYVSPGDADWIATITQANYDKLQPNLDEWRQTTLADINAAQVIKIELAGQGRAITLEKQGPAWMITKPDKIDADDAHVSLLIESINQLEATRFIDNPSDDYKAEGLDTPEWTVSIYRQGQLEPVIIELGSTSGTGLYRHVRRSGQTSVAAVPESDAAKIIVTLDDLRDRQVFSFNQFDATELDVSRGDNAATYHLIRDESTQNWQMISPEQGTHDNAVVMELVKQLSSLKVDSYVESLPTADDDTNVTEITVTVQPPDKAATDTAPANDPTESKPTYYTAKVFSHGGKYYVSVTKSSGAVVPDMSADGTISESVYNKLTAELLDRSVGAPMATDDVTEIAITNTSGAMTFARSSDGEDETTWNLVQDTLVDVDSGAVTDAINAARNLEATRFTALQADEQTLADYGLNSPAIAVELRTGTAGIWRLLISASDDNIRHATVAGTGRVFTIDTDDANQWTGTVRDFIADDSEE